MEAVKDYNPLMCQVYERLYLAVCKIRPRQSVDVIECDQQARDTSSQIRWLETHDGNKTACVINHR
jgi:hypothetical protein